MGVVMAVAQKVGVKVSTKPLTIEAENKRSIIVKLQPAAEPHPFYSPVSDFGVTNKQYNELLKKMKKVLSPGETHYSKSVELIMAADTLEFKERLLMVFLLGVFHEAQSGTAAKLMLLEDVTKWKQRFQEVAKNAS